MKGIVIFLFLFAVSVLLFPTLSWALQEGACFRDTVPRTTSSDDFTVIGDGSIVRHEVTGLEWQRCARGQAWDGNTCNGSAHTATWAQALLGITATLGFSPSLAADGWRLPNVKELLSIVEECAFPSINPVVFPNSPSGHFWSSTPGPQTTWAWKVDLGSGTTASKPNTERKHIRLVRDNQ